MPGTPFKIIHLITSLEGGGTENFLYQVLARSPEEFQHRVLYLKKDGVIGERIRGIGIPVSRARSTWDVWKTLKRERPQILHTCLYRAHQIGRLLGHRAGVPCVVSSQRSIDAWAKAWHRALDGWTLKYCDAVFANSAAAARCVRERRLDFPSSRIVQLANGIGRKQRSPEIRNQCRTRWHIPAEAIVGVTLTRLHSEKGADLIPAVADEWLREWPNLHLVIAGTGPMEATLKTQTGRSAYKDRIHWIGWTDDAIELLSAADFFWLLSREESFPQALIEAAGAGLPWVAPDVGGIAEIKQVGGVGLLFPLGDSTAMAAAYRQLMLNLPTLTRHAQSAAASIQDQFSVDRMAERFYELLSNLPGMVPVTKLKHSAPL